MESQLKLFLIIICLIFDMFIYNKVEKGKLQLKHSFAWYILSIVLMFLAIFDKALDPLQSFLGFETKSNMIFVIGFFLLAMIVFSLSVKVSEQSMKITRLTQEVALLKKGDSNGKHKKTSK